MPSIVEPMQARQPSDRVTGSSDSAPDGPADLLTFVLHRRPYPAAEIISMLMHQGLSVTDRPLDEQSLELVRQLDPFIIIIAVETGEERDVEVVRSLRQHSDAYIIMLIRKPDPQAMAQVIEAGADVFVRESDGIAVLEAFVRSFARRDLGATAHRTPSNVVGDLVLRPAQRLVECQGKSVRLTALEFAILSALASAPGQVMSPARILETAGIADPRPSAVSQLKVHVLRIRRKLREICPEHEHIVNLRGTGYMLDRIDRSD
ncbi:MAG: response regulator transcription factor [Dehalococcoidia bacterium]|nr:response regulator transcription factor [Dehalococcoidia bacterium]